MVKTLLLSSIMLPIFYIVKLVNLSQVNIKHDAKRIVYLREFLYYSLILCAYILPVRDAFSWTVLTRRRPRLWKYSFYSCKCFYSRDNARFVFEYSDTHQVFASNWTVLSFLFKRICFPQTSKEVSFSPSFSHQIADTIKDYQIKYNL